MSALDETIGNLVATLLEKRVAAGHWEGTLSASALSTATAVAALALAPGRDEKHIRAGLDWLTAHQNKDGGWGDTIVSLSNVSTTCLCWSALAIAGADAPETIAAAESWLKREAGGLDTASLTTALLKRYGNDRTFSVPILTVLALAKKVDWRSVPQLPFELAACPYQWFQWIQLPVVSYALPALIAIGQARHYQAPTRNPITRILRAWTRQPTLRILKNIQPSTGGFLEATPLTSFVVMSLAASGQADHPVVTEGVRFLLRSMREDGSWAIDSNLATWGTTLAINAMAKLEKFPLADEESARVRDWLLDQQYKAEHPYTHASPGGWAWTDLPGGVPDADDTPGALVALKHLLPRGANAPESICHGVRWLLALQNRDGGIPTFCRGWGKLQFDRSSPDLTAHTLLAWDAWYEDLPLDLRESVARASRRAIGFLSRAQREDGSWVPLWFGNQHAPNEENPTYGTSRVLIALSKRTDAAAMRDRGIQWLLDAQNADGGWGGAKGVASSIEETAISVDALSAQLEAVPALTQGVEWLIENTNCGLRTPPSPIGFYFARLWYFEELYPIIFALSGLAASRKFIESATLPRNRRSP